jgi:hypothetical protein
MQWKIMTPTAQRSRLVPTEMPERVCSGLKYMGVQKISSRRGSNVNREENIDSDKTLENKRNMEEQMREPYLKYMGVPTTFPPVKHSHLSACMRC